jgi:hypothetical protein
VKQVNKANGTGKQVKTDKQTDKRQTNQANRTEQTNKQNKPGTHKRKTDKNKQTNKQTNRTRTEQTDRQTRQRQTNRSGKQTNQDAHWNSTQPRATALSAIWGHDGTHQSRPSVLIPAAAVGRQQQQPGTATGRPGWQHSAAGAAAKVDRRRVY